MSEQLTDEDRAAIKAVGVEMFGRHWVNVAGVAGEFESRVYVAGKAAGARAMREAAQQAVMSKWTGPTDMVLDGDTIDAYAEAVIALPIRGEP